MSNDEVWRALLQAREERVRCALVTVAATTGSVPRAPGAKMLVHADGRTIGTVGGGKFESLVVADCAAAIEKKVPLLKRYPLHEGDADSFGAICGGEVTVLIEPQFVREAIFLVGAGHCARAIAHLAHNCGWHVTAIDDRAGMLTDFPADQLIPDRNAREFIESRAWSEDEAIVIVSRHYDIDRDALRAALRCSGAGYIGMIGSRRKVRRVFDQLLAEGISAEQLARVFAPIGLDIGSDSPAEIAVSVLAEILQVLRGRGGGHLRGV